MESKTTEIFYLADEFCKEFYKADLPKKFALNLYIIDNQQIYFHLDRTHVK